MIKQFQNEYRWLSNFWLTDIVIGSKLYRSAEHYYQACKALNEETHEIIRKLEKPSDAKRYAKNIKWNIDKIKVMEKTVFEKFNQNEELKKKLILTYPEILQEGNYWHDTFWGVDLKTGIGDNRLGKILMEVRHKFVFV